MMMRVRRRMTTKAPDPSRAGQESLLSPPDLGMEDASSKRQVYLITFPHPRVAVGRGGAPLVAPGTLSHEEIIAKVLEACAAPIATSPNPLAASTPVVLSTAAAFREYHKAEDADEPRCHYHVAVKAETCFRFAPVKKALQEKFGLASHWSCTHNGYWSPVRYCAVPSPKKTRSMLDPCPLLWSRAGAHPPLHLCCHEPQTAMALRAKRQRKEDAAAESSRAEPRVTEYDLWPIVVESQIKNTPDDRNAHLRFMQYVKSHCSQTVCAFVFKNRARLPGLIDDIWRWEMVDDVLAAAVEPLIQSLRSATAMPCVCGGAWARYATYTLGINRVDASVVCKAIVHALLVGRSPTTPVVTFAGRSGGEGKSFFLKGLVSVFGAGSVFNTPQHVAFPLHGLESAKLAFLDDFRFVRSPVPLATQCLWLDGSPVSIAKPQNTQGAVSHEVYTGRAPIFITTSIKDLEMLARAGDGDASMVLRRLMIFQFVVRAQKPNAPIPECASCFARFVCQHARQ